MGSDYLVFYHGTTEELSVLKKGFQVTSDYEDAVLYAGATVGEKKIEGKKGLTRSFVYKFHIRSDQFKWENKSGDLENTGKHATLLVDVEAVDVNTLQSIC